MGPLADKRRFGDTQLGYQFSLRHVVKVSLTVALSSLAAQFPGLHYHTADGRNPTKPLRVLVMSYIYGHAVLISPTVGV